MEVRDVSDLAKIGEYLPYEITIKNMLHLREKNFAKIPHALKWQSLKTYRIAPIKEHHDPLACVCVFFQMRNGKEQLIRYKANIQITLDASIIGNGTNQALPLDGSLHRLQRLVSDRVL